MLAVLVSVQAVYCEEFFYTYKTGDKYRIISVVKEDVFLNRRLSHKAEILNRIAVEVAGVHNDTGTLKAVFQTSEKSSRVSDRRNTFDASFQWSREYQSVFDRDKLGYLSVEPQYFMPVVRNVPVFPDKELKIGDKWSAEAYEIHDFRDSFGIEEPYKIPFTAYYTYLGMKEWRGKAYPAFLVTYKIDTQPKSVKGKLWPQHITGASDQTIYWSFELGQPIAYSENFRITFSLSDGNIIEFRGTAQAEIVESESMDKEKIAGEIEKDIEREKIEDTTVRVVDEGISISLEDIKFFPDSAILLDSEKTKLDRLGEILKKYPDRDIMVSGHTALAGTADERMKLSVERAKAVTDYLLSKRVRTADRIVVRGFGAEKPVADNATEEGKRKNRRVEITILEN
jgi:outer membrane protein OmpA-like peptidoglycan-associated protein